MRRILLLVVALTFAIGLTAASATADQGARSWRITVENLTPAGSQPLSPPLFVVHGKRVDVWSVGEIANHGVAAIAEDANNAPLESALPSLAGVRDVFTGAGGPIPSGESRSYIVQANGPRDRLTLLTMLVNTNDAFTGLDSLQFRNQVTMVDQMAYDAGSERNNELAGFIPGPCCNNPFVRDPEGALIAPHPGITGVGDLDPAVYNWTGPAAKITVELIP
jgi:hypothetical protein